MANALSTRNPAHIRAEAERLRVEGYHAQAEDLVRAAATIEAENSRPSPAVPAPSMPTLPSLPPTIPAVPMPKPPKAVPLPKPPKGNVEIGPVVIESVDPRKQLALDVVKNLTMHPVKGTEDKALILSFQRQEGTTNPKGTYGMGTGLGLIKYDLVPPKPRYWSTGQAGIDQKKRWRNEMLTMARKDPARAAEWQGASQV